MVKNKYIFKVSKIWILGTQQQKLLCVQILTNEV